jgi:hypothetical protein
MEQQTVAMGELEVLHSQVPTQSTRGSLRAIAMVREVGAIPITSLAAGLALDAHWQTALAALAHELLG